MVVALTGGIGSGKTTVSKIFEAMGCIIYNTDEEAKNLYNDIPIKNKIINLFGTDTYTNNGKLNNKLLSEKVFNNADLLQQLNTIIHPAIKIHFEEFKKQYTPQTLIIKESALIFEANLYKDLNHIILVIAPIEQRIKRVMQRNGISEIEVEKRIRNQWTDEQKIPLSHYIISNEDNVALIPQIIPILNQLKAICINEI